MKYSGIILLCCALMVKGQGPLDVTTLTTPSAVTDSNATTTEAPTTTTKKETTTTPPPTTTSPPSTTTPKPSPTPTPSPPIPDYPKNSHKWTIEDENNSTCIALKCAMQIVVVNENKTETVNVSPYATPTGNCGEPQKITLTWDSDVSGKQNSLSFTLAANISKENALAADTGITVGKYALQSVDAVLYLNSTNATEFELKNIDVFQTPLNHSYSCLAEEVLKSNDGHFSLKIREVQLEAFRLTPVGHTEFSAAIQCSADDATDVVPIAVGAALAGLVVIVLIAYLIGRKRSRARGYQSV